MSNQIPPLVPGAGVTSLVLEGAAPGLVGDLATALVGVGAGLTSPLEAVDRAGAAVVPHGPGSLPLSMATPGLAPSLASQLERAGVPVTAAQGSASVALPSFHAVAPPVEPAVGLAPDRGMPVPVDNPANIEALSPSQKNQIERVAHQFVNELAALHPQSPVYGERVRQLIDLGKSEIAAAAGRSSHFLEQPIHTIEQEATTVGNDLLQLRQEIENLTPRRPKTIFGVALPDLPAPLRNKMRAHAGRHQSAQTHINEILKRLKESRTRLATDNQAIVVERLALWEAMNQLAQRIHVAQALDSGLEAAAARLEATDPARAKAMRETALFYVRQRTTDLLTQQAVSTQGYLALDLVQRNNVELDKSVERASTTTVAALGTALIMAQALASQKMVLKQTQALNATTEALLKRTAQDLREQGAQIHEQAISATISPQVVQDAFNDVSAAVDAVDTFKGKALEQMKATVAALTRQVEQSRAYIERAQSMQARALPEDHPQAPALAD